MNSATFTAMLAAATLVATPAAASAQDTGQVFKPSGQWALDYGDDYCRLSRTFSDGQQSLSLAWERIAPGPFTRMILVSNGIKPFRSAHELGWHFTPSGSERKAPYTKSTVASGEAYYNLGMVTFAPTTPPAPGGPPAPPPPYDRAAEQGAAKAFDGFVIDNGVTAPVQVETGNLQQPIGALQACADDLAKTWGLDPAKLKSQTAAVTPAGSPAGWLPQGTIAFTDFPKLADGSNQVRMMVDAEGKPTACTVASPSLDKSINEHICKALMSTAKFVPAKDAAGQSMASYFVASPMMLLPPPPTRRR